MSLELPALTVKTAQQVLERFEVLLYAAAEEDYCKNADGEPEESSSEIGCGPCMDALARVRQQNPATYTFADAHCACCIFFKQDCCSDKLSFHCLRYPFNGVTHQALPASVLSLGCTFEGVVCGYIKDKREGWQELEAYLQGHIEWAKRYLGSE